MIENLLAYSRVGTRRREPCRVNSTDCLRHALANLSVAIQEAGARVEQATLPAVLAGEGLLTQVFQNLVHNAIKFRGKQSPCVWVTASTARNMCIFRVTDNGVGVPAEHQRRIFQVFQRLHSREEASGTGIGLALCKRVVEQYGGEIGVEAAATGGACFFFSLPLA
jgi:light-regulated signal transduction histidine kinase (bacteriophytochrome)